MSEFGHHPESEEEPAIKFVFPEITRPPSPRQERPQDHIATLLERYPQQVVETLKTAVEKGQFVGYGWMETGPGRIDLDHRSTQSPGFTSYWDNSLEGGEDEAAYLLHEEFALPEEAAKQLVSKDGVDELIRIHPQPDGTIAIGYDALARAQPHGYKALDPWGRPGDLLKYVIVLPPADARDLAATMWRDPSTARELPGIAVTNKLGAQFTNTMPFDKWAERRNGQAKTRFVFGTSEQDIVDRPVHTPNR